MCPTRAWDNFLYEELTCAESAKYSSPAKARERMRVSVGLGEGQNKIPSPEGAKSYSKSTWF